MFRFVAISILMIIEFNIFFCFDCAVFTMTSLDGNVFSQAEEQHVRISIWPFSNENIKPTITRKIRKKNKRKQEAFHKHTEK